MMTNQSSMTLWQAIDALIAQLPFSASKIEQILSTRLLDTQAPDSDVFQFFEGSEVHLADGIDISRIDLRIRREGAHPGFLVIDLQGRCVRGNEVGQHYAELMLTEVPRGRSLDEAASYTAMLPWGRLSFGFKERNPECLAFVAFDPS